MLATTGSSGARSSSLARVCRSGSLTGATIAVWNAWLTGMRAAVYPAEPNASMARSTASVAPPITAWCALLILATTT